MADKAKKEDKAEASVDATDANSPIRQLFDRLLAEKADLEERVRPLREKRDGLRNQAMELDRQIEVITDEIRAIEHPKLIDLSKEIARLLRALPGNRTLSGR